MAILYFSSIIFCSVIVSIVFLGKFDIQKLAFSEALQTETQKDVL